MCLGLWPETQCTCLCFDQGTSLCQPYKSSPPLCSSQTNFGYRQLKPSHLMLKRLSRRVLKHHLTAGSWTCSQEHLTMFCSTSQKPTWWAPGHTWVIDRGKMVPWLPVSPLEGLSFDFTLQQAEEMPHWTGIMMAARQPHPWHVASTGPFCPSPSMMALPSLLQPRRASDLAQEVPQASWGLALAKYAVHEDRLGSSLD